MRSGELSETSSPPSSTPEAETSSTDKTFTNIASGSSKECSSRSYTEEKGVERTASEENFQLSNIEVEQVAGVVRVLAELCGRSEVQQWLGRGPGSLLWNTLLTVLGQLYSLNASYLNGKLN